MEVITYESQVKDSTLVYPMYHRGDGNGVGEKVSTTLHRSCIVNQFIIPLNSRTSPRRRETLEAS